MFSLGDEHWTSQVSLPGALLWALLAALAGNRRAPLGVIELLFLFAPLVVVPLGLELISAVSTPGISSLENMARAVQPFAALSLVAAFWYGPGKTAGLLAIPWVAVCGAVALSGLARLRPPMSLATFVGSIARMDLGLAGGWLLMSRFGLHPLRFQEPIILLTAVHFHYSGFATAAIAGTGLGFAQRSGKRGAIWSAVVLLVTLLPFALAAGFVFSPTLRTASAVAFSLSVVLLAILLVLQSTRFHSDAARIFVRVACLFVVAGMALAASYAVGEYTHRDWLTIPRMASTHGWVNALGFVMPALLGCLMELRWRTGNGGLDALREVSRRQWPARHVQGARTARPRFVARDFYDF
jgi:hypothetical protein